LKQNSFPHSKV